MQKFAATILLFFCSVCMTFKQDKIGTISGQVTEKLSREPVEGATVSNETVNVQTDAEGNYKLFSDRFDNGKGECGAALAPDVIQRVDFSAGTDFRAERKFDFNKWSIAQSLDMFNVFTISYKSQVDYEFNRRNPQFLDEGTRIPIFGMRLEV